MPTWMDLEPREHQVAIAGKVIDAATGRAMAGVRVAMIGMPASFQRWLSLRALSHGDRWETLAERPDRAATAADGSFYFKDLPDGEYRLSFSATKERRRYGTLETDVTVARGADGQVALTFLTMKLPPTGVQGRVVVQGDSGAVPLAMARVRLLGSGEQTYSGPDGSYSLTAVLPGPDQLSITASGHEAAKPALTLVEGTITALGDTALSPTPD